MKIKFDMSKILICIEYYIYFANMSEIAHSGLHLFAKTSIYRHGKMPFPIILKMWNSLPLEERDKWSIKSISPTLSPLRKNEHIIFNECSDYSL